MIRLIPHFKSVLCYALVAFVFLALLYNGIFKEYGYTDSYEFLWSANNVPIFKHVFIQSGRPLYGELNQLIFGTLCSTISDLKWIRTFSLLSCVLLSTQIFKLLLQINFKKLEAALFSLLVLAIPSIGIYVGWSVTYEIPLALNCSFFAGVLILQKNSNKPSLLTFFLALVFNIVALNLYQPAGTAFLIPLVFYSVIHQKQLVSQFIRFFLLFVFSFGLYFIIFKISLHFYNIPALERTGFDLINLPYHFFKFYFRELKNTFYGSAILFQSIPLLFIGSSLVVGFFILIFNKNKLQRNYILLIFLLLILPISFTPNLLSIDKFITSRTIAVTAIIVLFYQFYFLRELSSNSTFVKYLSFILAFIFIIGGSYNVNIYFTKIAVKEYTSLKSVFISLPINTDKQIILIRPQEAFLQKSGAYNQSFADEFVQISTERNWVPIPLFHQIMKEHFDENYSMLNVKTIGVNDTYEDSEKIIVINLEDILQEVFSEQPRPTQI